MFSVSLRAFLPAYSVLRSHGLLACDFEFLATPKSRSDNSSDPVADATGIGCIDLPGLIRATSKSVHSGHRIPQNPSLTQRVGMRR